MFWMSLRNSYFKEGKFFHNPFLGAFLWCTYKKGNMTKEMNNSRSGCLGPWLFSWDVVMTEMGKAQPRGSIKTNQLYRRAMGLPLRYNKASFAWYLNYKQMSNRCKTSTGSRDWTKEEMMAYLDWDRSEDAWIDARVVQEIGSNPSANGRRGMAELWEMAETDIAEQQALYTIQ